MTEELDRLRARHTSAAIERSLSRGPSVSYLRDFVYGAIDGTITTFAVVAAAEGAGLSSSIVIILGCANLVGDGFSMAVGNFLGLRAEQDRVAHLRTEELHHITHVPEGEKEEIRQIYNAKGFAGEELEKIVERITADRELWLGTMLQEEHGISKTEASPWRAAASTFFAFGVCGAVPLLPYVIAWFGRLDAHSVFPASLAMTAATFFGVGALKSALSARKWYLAGIETLVMGSSAAALAYVVGHLLRGLAS